MLGTDLITGSTLSSSFAVMAEGLSLGGVGVGGVGLVGSGVGVGVGLVGSGVGGA